LNATAAGTETLKNLILPGVGSYTIIDPAQVTERDLGNNFFVCQNDLLAKRGRAECITRNLNELNGDVKGSFDCRSVESVLQDDVVFMDQFSCIIACDVEMDTLLKLSHYTLKNIPLIIAR
jgi:amyloid beta precursor protein binding protein 1